MPILKDILRQMDIAVVECPSYEADDILGTLSRRAEQAGLEVLLVTGDRDALPRRSAPSSKRRHRARITG